MYLYTTFLSLGLVAAASTGSFCCSVESKSCRTSGTAFCSSYLKIPAKTTTITTTAVVTTSTTSTIVSPTVTTRIFQTFTQPITAVTTATTTFTALSTSTTTTTTTVTGTRTKFENFYPFPGGCTFDGPEDQIQKRATSTLSRPPCLTAYASGNALSSACSCLSIPVSTSTVTKGTTRTTTVVRTTVVPSTVKTTTKTTLSKTVSTATAFKSRTVTSTVTTTAEETSYTTVLETLYLVDKVFHLKDSDSVDDDNNKGQIIDNGLQFSAGGIGIGFSLNPNYNKTANCTLMSEQGQQAEIDQYEGIIRWASPETVTNYVQCQFNENNLQLYCRNPLSMEPENYGRGWLDSNKFWRILPLTRPANIRAFQTFGL